MLKRLLIVTALTLSSPAVAQPVGSGMSREAQEQARTAIFAATAAPDFRRYQILLEVYRTLRAAGVMLSPAEAFEMGEAARQRGLPIEAAEAYGLLLPDDPKYRHNEGLIAHIKEQAGLDRAGGVERSAEIAMQRNDADYLGIVAEAFAAQGEFGRAIPLYERALGFKVSDPTMSKVDDPTKWSDAYIAKQASELARLHGRDASFYSVELQQRRAGLLGPEPSTSEEFTLADKARIQLNYGISQFRLQRVDQARATWSAITGSPCVEILARAWLDIADRSVN